MRLQCDPMAADIQRLQYEIATYGKVGIPKIKEWTNAIYNKAATTIHMNSRCVLIGLERIKSRLMAGETEEEIDAELGEVLSFMD